MPLVVVAGPVAWNLIVRVPVLPAQGSPTLVAAGHRDALGGTSAGKALGLARLGIDVMLRTVLGDDDAAPRVRAALAHPRLTLAAAVAPGATERHLNLMADDGSRVSIYLDTPGDPGAVPGPVLAALGDAAVAVVDLAEHARGFLGLARAAGVPVWCDLHDWDGHEPFHQDFADAADVVVVSDDRLADPRGFLTARVAAGARWAVCTQGARGAVALGRDEGWLEVPAVRVPEVVDTNGAGDAFVSGLLLGHLEGRDLGHSLRLAAAAGAMAVSSAHLVSPGMSADEIRALAGLAA